MLLYQSLQVLVEGRTNAVEMPTVNGKSGKSLKEILLRVDTCDGGGRPVYISCYESLRTLGFCDRLSYGYLLLGTHAH